MILLPAPGPPAAGPCIRTGRVRYSWHEVTKVPMEPQVLISTSAAAAAHERRRSERLSLRAAIFWISGLSLAAWAVITALARALL